MRQRFMIAMLILAALAALLGWQWRRGGLAAQCRADGGVWHGDRSRCEAPRPVILQRDLRRT